MRNNFNLQVLTLLIDEFSSKSMLKLRLLLKEERFPHKVQRKRYAALIMEVNTFANYHD